MKFTYQTLLILLIFGNANCQSQTKKNMKEQANPLLCNPNTGLCEIPESKTDSTNATQIKSDIKPIKVIYFTDPICSSCWGIEPQLRKLKLEYGNNIEIEYKMGGLLPDWSYNSGGISKPADVAHHWDEVSLYYDMPIDGDVWLSDPLSSSYPPSIAFKAAQLQDDEKAILFLREIREMVFLYKKNITKWEFLELAAKNVSLDTKQLKSDYETKAIELFKQDLKLGKELGIRGFPTMIFTNNAGKKEIVYGSKPYSDYQHAITTLYPDAQKNGYSTTWDYVFLKYKTLTAKEYSELTGMPRNECENYLNELTLKGKLEKHNTKNGAIWKLKS
jgi:putative protein-disulfide isomerase